jgi:HAD superfamily phosphoserine phosphatase-like hydrolase
MARDALPALAIFDVCDTLFATNTTFAFLNFYATPGHAPRLSAALKRWTSRRSPAFYIGAAIYRLTGADLARNRAIAALKGEDRAALESAATRFAEDVLPSFANQPVMQRLAQHKSAGDEVLLASSSLDIVIAPIARGLGVDFLASRLGFDGSICTGRLDPDLTGTKLSALERHGLNRGRAVHVYTDNRSDASLLAAATVANIILPRDGRSRRWGTEQCNYIEL